MCRASYIFPWPFLYFFSLLSSPHAIRKLLSNLFSHCEFLTNDTGLNNCEQLFPEERHTYTGISARTINWLKFLWLWRDLEDVSLEHNLNFLGLSLVPLIVICFSVLFSVLRDFKGLLNIGIDLWYAKRVILHIETSEFIPDDAELTPLFLHVQDIIRNRLCLIFITHIRSHMCLPGPLA